MDNLNAKQIYEFLKRNNGRGICRGGVGTMAHKVRCYYGR